MDLNGMEFYIHYKNIQKMAGMEEWMDVRKTLLKDTKDGWLAECDNNAEAVINFCTL